MYADSCISHVSQIYNVLYLTLINLKLAECTCTYRSPVRSLKRSIKVNLSNMHTCTVLWVEAYL